MPDYSSEAEASLSRVSVRDPSSFRLVEADHVGGDQAVALRRRLPQRDVRALRRQRLLQLRELRTGTTQVIKKGEDKIIKKRKSLQQVGVPSLEYYVNVSILIIMFHIEKKIFQQLASYSCECNNCFFYSRLGVPRIPPLSW